MNQMLEGTGRRGQHLPGQQRGRRQKDKLPGEDHTGLRVGHSGYPPPSRSAHPWPPPCSTCS